MRRRSPTGSQTGRRRQRTLSPLHTLTAAAFALPGLLPLAGQAAAGEPSVDFQYSRYEEGRRKGFMAFHPGISRYGINPDIRGSRFVPNTIQPITVDTLRGRASFGLTDRITLNLNYSQDTWSGATPLGTVPSPDLAYYFDSAKGKYLYPGDTTVPVIIGASPFANATNERIYVDKDHNFYQQEINPETGKIGYRKAAPVHVMSYASPETRNQGDFRVGYEWDNAALTAGGGISLENDYKSRFANLAGRMDFNQKLTTVNLGASYTNSSIDARLEPIGAGYINYEMYRDQVKTRADGHQQLRGTRQDWGVTLGLDQVLSKNIVASLGFGYTHSSGFLENPYKLVWLFVPNFIGRAVGRADDGTLIFSSSEFYGGQAHVEQRPDERNLFNWSMRWAQYVAPLNAALHLGYNFAHDDWSIHAHTFEANWVQPVAAGWVIAPRIRYYSQSAADFYTTGLITTRTGRKPPDAQHGYPYYRLPEHFSSDQRLSGFGTLSGGVTLSKQFTRGVGIEAGFEYYTHQGGLKLGGGGERSFADFDFWVANAALKINMATVGQMAALASRPNGGDTARAAHHPSGHGQVPAGVLFGHMPDRAGDLHVGYRYQRSWQSGFRHGTQDVTELAIEYNGCPDLQNGCLLLPKRMSSNMHMLELMYAVTDRVTLMVMPQFMDMEMPQFRPADKPVTSHGQLNGGHSGHIHQTGGVGDTGLYAMFSLLRTPQHRLHVTAGVTAPTGSHRLRQKISKEGDLYFRNGNFQHYNMQLGSGTWDFRPSLTYTGEAGRFSWGAQVGGTKRLENRNSANYALGDMFETSAWVGLGVTPWLNATVRTLYTWQGRIKGAFPGEQGLDVILQSNCPRFRFIGTRGRFDQQGFDTCIADARRGYVRGEYPPSSSQDHPGNYGGRFVHIGLGVNATIPKGMFAGNRFAFEWLQPVHVDVNGYQLDLDGALSFSWNYTF